MYKMVSQVVPASGLFLVDDYEMKTYPVNKDLQLHLSENNRPRLESIQFLYSVAVLHFSCNLLFLMYHTFQNY